MQGENKPWRGAWNRSLKVLEVLGGLGSPSSVPDESTLPSVQADVFLLLSSHGRDPLSPVSPSKDTNSIHESFTSRPNHLPKALSLNTVISGIKVLRMNLGATQSFSLQQLPSSEDEKYLYSYRASVSWGCCNKALHTGWLKQQKFISHSSRGYSSQVSRAVF